MTLNGVMVKLWPRYGDFSIFQDGGRRHLRFSNFVNFNNRKAQEGQTALPCQISSISVICKNRQHCIESVVARATQVIVQYNNEIRVWANAQRDGRPAEYRWRPLFNSTKFGWRPLLLPCSNAAKTRNPLKCGGVPQTRQQISAASAHVPKFTILWGHVGDTLLFKSFFP